MYFYIQFKNMKKTFYLAISILIFACNGVNNREFNLKEAKGGKFYGGTFRYNEEEYFKTLYPLNITEVTAHRLCEQIYEGLVTFNDTSLAIEPSLAENWDIDATGTKYTFY